ncbi:hypothetical protein BJ165DRAFT_1477390 [Panaeolus papilionaceus]|nr:hypothetical protein BJ165DRAFT_1477390 [Panaeolus papilionaceus]
MLEANMPQTVYSVSPHPRHFNLNSFLLDSGLIDTLPGNLEGRANVRLGELRTIQAFENSKGCNVKSDRKSSYFNGKYSYGYQFDEDAENRFNNLLSDRPKEERNTPQASRNSQEQNKDEYQSDSESSRSPNDHLYALVKMPPSSQREGV